MRKSKFLIILVIMVLIGTCSNVKANPSNSFTATISPASQTIQQGEEMVITVGVSNINMGEAGINAFEGIIEYDKELFEAVTSSDIQAKNNWTVTYNDENSSMNGKFLAVNLTPTGVTNTTVIFTVRLKSRSNVIGTKTTKVIFKDLVSNDGDDLIKTAEKTVNVTINGKSQQPTNIINNVITNVITNTTNTTNTIRNTTNTANTTNTTRNVLNTTNVVRNTTPVNTTSSGNMPKTGKSDVIITLIIIAGLIGVFFWKRNSYWKGL